MARISRTTRAVAALGAELVSGAIWAIVDPLTVAEHAVWIVLVGLALIALAWFWDEILRYLRWRRGALPVHVEIRTARLPQRIAAGDNQRHHRFVNWGDNHVSLTAGGMLWSDEDRQVDWGPDGPPLVERIAVTNYSADTLASATIVLHTTVMKAEKTENGSKSGEVIFEGDFELRTDPIAANGSRPTIAFIGNETPFYINLSVMRVFAKPMGAPSRLVEAELGGFGEHMGLAPAKRYNL